MIPIAMNSFPIPITWKILYECDGLAFLIAFVYYIWTLVVLGLFVNPTSSNRALTFHHFVITLGPIKYKFTFYTKQETWTHKHTPRSSFHFRKQKSNLFSTHSLPKVNDEINCHEHRLYAWAFYTSHLSFNILGSFLRTKWSVHLPSPIYICSRMNPDPVGCSPYIMVGLPRNASEFRYI